MPLVKLNTVQKRFEDGLEKINLSRLLRNILFVAQNVDDGLANHIGMKSMLVVKSVWKKNDT